MNTGKMCGLVVMLCVICPLLVGYVWPIDTTTEINYVNGNPIDISADAINYNFSLPSLYNDPFNNNINVFYDGAFNNNPVKYSYFNASPVWNINVVSNVSDTVTPDASGTYRINDVGTWQSWGTTIFAVIFYLPSGSGWYEMNVNDGGVGIADMVIYYPQTDVMFYSPDGIDGLFPTTDHSIEWYGSTSPKDIYWREYLISSYADLSEGFIVPSDKSTWMNGYGNEQLNILFDTSDFNSQVDLTFRNTVVSLTVSSGTIGMEASYSGTQYFNQDLGDNSIYDYVLLTMDKETSTISLSGLRGFNSFTDNYASSIRNTITANWNYATTIYGFDIQQISGSNAWYVPNTIAGINTVSGSEDFILDLRDYNASGSCMLNLRSVQLHGDTFRIEVNSTMYNGSINGNNLVIVSDSGETITQPINDLLIGLIDDVVYLNGYVLADPGVAVTNASIYFDGNWLMSLYYYPVTAEPTPGYLWTAGSFGLNVSGFCVAGLMTSFGSALGLGVYGKRSGSRVAAVTITALCCAAFYLIMLMQ